MATESTEHTEDILGLRRRAKRVRQNHSVYFRVIPWLSFS